MSQYSTDLLHAIEVFLPTIRTALMLCPAIWFVYVAVAELTGLRASSRDKDLPEYLKESKRLTAELRTKGFK